MLHFSTMGNTLDHTGSKGFKWTQDRLDQAQKLDIPIVQGMSPGDAIDELLDAAETLEEVQRKKKKEIREKREQLRDEETLYDLD